ncbi:hypothetical protein [Curtobacterium sp. GD1]|uniref:hypothetical protein n=1 Tax=Curtobacterium sp. GD1 TaxID=2810612 RepID=UPI001E5F99B6|nr:hypothetical protein [Curtobacterium sp. GD1]MCC8907986.1 hypothetical protein [Curtobacterium sp. GD1]
MLGSVVLVGILAVAACSLRSLALPCIVAVIAFVAVPEAAVYTLGVPGLGGVNLGVLVVMATATVQVLFRAPTYLADVMARPWIWIVLAVWIAGATITNFVATSSSPSTWAELVVAPPAAYLLVQRLGAESAAGRALLARAIVTVAALEAVLALAIWTGVVDQPFAEAHSTFTYWWTPEYARALGTMDSSLVLAGLMLAAIGLLASVRSNWMVIATSALFLVTIATAESRGALGLGLVVLTVLLVRRRVPFATALGLVFAAVMTLAVVVLVNPELTDGLSAKLEDDNGSANARVRGIAVGVPAALETTLVGNGPSSSFSIARSLGLATSFENPVIMTALDWGLLPALAFVTAQLFALRSGFRARVRVRGDVLVPGALLAASAYSVYLLTFSSYALTSGIAVFTWIVLGLTAPPNRELPRTERALNESQPAVAEVRS